MHTGEIVADPLAWWQMHEKKFPTLSILARRTLCILATSAPSERIFSVAGLAISKCHTSVQPQNASDLIFLHNSWPLAEECEKKINRNRKFYRKLKKLSVCPAFKRNLSDFRPTSVRLLSDFCPTSVRLLSDTDKLKVSENVGLFVRRFRGCPTVLSDFIFGVGHQP